MIHELPGWEKLLEKQAEVQMEQVAAQKMSAIASTIDGAIHKLGQGIGNAIMGGVATDEQPVSGQISQISGSPEISPNSAPGLIPDQSPGVTVTPGIGPTPAAKMPIDIIKDLSLGDQPQTTVNQFAKDELELL